MNIQLMRRVLKAGSLVFGISALFLLVFPCTFLGLLNLERNDALAWSMRMIGVTVFALAGNMWNNSQQQDEERVVSVAKIMAISAAGLGALTLLIPVHLVWFTYLYAAVGFGFSIAYLVALFKK